ncbi:amidohydrolase family protein [Mucilaginibacter myungsuensis]|uniref:Amidohydrolase family protein n=1 Tax=Mucilaginibacter myungsuensis TaxID=649104 RepID=A0A929KX63_9SPHI|nr:amidohydrolase family protein [Mucilaginibacter myungsuensis]MBE9662110.1 amidohydrolase family protein [Mucilaginibacter myungsuensis]MDN3599456.1 amidohydrolase family protein [Mucilaginibacter myungsuensis]
MNHIDSHNHFWRYDPSTHGWISPEMGVIRRDFSPADLWPVLTVNGMEGTVAVQADQTEAETEYLLQLAEENDFIKGVVGWIDLQADDIDERLKHYSAFKKLKGFRHILQGEAKRDLMLTPKFKHGISKLGQYGFTYDILIFVDQLKYAVELADEFPEQRFVLDHIAKPEIAAGKIEDWSKGIKRLALRPNVWCKASGLVTEAKWDNWTNDTFSRYLDVVFDSFGVERIMFGSDWPVCLVAGEYAAVKDIITEYTENLSDADRQKIFRNNAIKFYNL